MSTVDVASVLVHVMCVVGKVSWKWFVGNGARTWAALRLAASSSLTSMVMAFRTLSSQLRMALLGT